MYKIILSLILFVLSFNLYTQESVLIPNTNVDAIELNHNLNRANDSLLLSSEFTIFKVEIFNSNFSKHFEISGTSVEIPLQDIPLGRHSIAVFVNRKIIMLTLLRDKPYALPKKKPITIETDSTESDTIRYKNIINRKHIVYIEDVVNITYDTIRIKSKNDIKFTTKEIPYDISTKNNDFRVIKQTREDFRKHNLRPNGLPFEEDNKN